MNINNITVVAVVAIVTSACLAAFIVHRTGSTDGLIDVGRAIATVIKALRGGGP